MDSMRSLNTSLPRSFPRRHPPADLHQAFKAAALSVAQLYKTAAADEDHARSIGYQDAIEELLAFLDQENLGLGDGEGWRVRQWATERLSPEAYGSDREEDAEESRPLRSSSPVVQRRVDPSPTIQQPIPASEPVQQEASQASPLSPIPNSTSANIEVPQEQATSSIPAEVFHFRSHVPSVSDTTMVNAERMDPPTVTSSSAERPSTNTNVPRIARRQSSRQNLRERTSATALAALGLGSAAKRKSPFGDIFEMNSLDNNRDNSGGGKRGRFT